MFHQAKGTFSKQAHVDVPEGTYEEEHGRDGFYGPVSHLYRTHPPTSWSRIEGPLKPHAYYCSDLKGGHEGNPVPDRTKILYNHDVAMHVAKPTGTPDWYFRNADGDELVFIHQGTGTLETDYGPLAFEPGDYVVIPRGTTQRFCPDGADNFFLVIESFSQIQEPERGLLGKHAFYDQSVMVTPEPDPQQNDAGEWEIKIKRQDQLTSFFYPFHPMDVVGWKGDLCPWKINVRDIRPVMSHAAHLPPSAHTTFTAQGFVMVTFLPRPLESSPGAMRVPFYHRNIDYDEVLFYHDGSFFSKNKSIKAGMITFHPQGFHHGPHPGVIDASWRKTETHEVAVMLDAVNPLTPTQAAESVEWADYWKSWQEKPGKEEATV